MKKYLIALAMWLGLIAPAFSQATAPVPATTGQISIPGAIISITKIVSGVAGKSIYVTAVMLVPTATAVVRFSYGTGTNCNSGTGTLSGDLVFSAGQTLAFGVGYGAIWVLPPGNDLCITITTSTAPGSLAYALF